MTFLDENVEMVRQVRDKLLVRYDGFDGLVRHFQAMDRQRERKRKRKLKRQKQKTGPAR